MGDFKEAMFYSKLEDSKVRCFLCNHRCVIGEGKRGICGVRENHGGRLDTLVYGKVIARHVDPVEKKPLFHFMPGSFSYSIATVGCNFRCLHCQNWEISQFTKSSKEIPGEDMTPEEIVEEAKRYNCASISYTYTEPTIFAEFAYDTAKLAKKEGIKNVFVTNGYITPEALKEIAPYLDAANIDIKGFSEEFYKKVCGAKLEHVLESVKLYHKLGVWIEIATLIIPGYNDKDEELRALAGFIKNISENIPWHVTRFHPDFKLTEPPPTPVETLIRARNIGKEAGLKYVYVGNVPGESGENTFCHACGELLVERYIFTITKNKIKNSACPKCGAKVSGIEMSTVGNNAGYG